jgi:uncharacterized protein with PQ loop repeat
VGGVLLTLWNRSGKMNNDPETWLGIANVAQLTVPLISLSAYVPQWIRLMKRRDSAAISMTSWSLWALSYSIGVFYSVTLLQVTGRGWPLVVTTSLGLFFVAITMLMVWIFRPANGR